MINKSAYVIAAVLESNSMVRTTALIRVRLYYMFYNFRFENRFSLLTARQ